MTTTSAQSPEPSTGAMDIPWSAVPDICESLGVSGSRIRRLISDRGVLGFKRGKPAVFHIPSSFFQESQGLVDVVEGLPGTITLLSDAGIADLEIIEWLHTEDKTLGTTPIEALRAGRRKPVRRSAQLLT